MLGSGARAGLGMTLFSSGECNTHLFARHTSLCQLNYKLDSVLLIGLIRRSECHALILHKPNSEPIVGFDCDDVGLTVGNHDFGFRRSATVDLSSFGSQREGRIYQFLCELGIEHVKKRFLYRRQLAS
jgi:hypothetical protein